MQRSHLCLWTRWESTTPLSMHPGKYTAGWILTTSEGFFQPHGLISCWQCPSERTMEVKCPFQRLIHREKHLLLPTLVVLTGQVPQTPTLGTKSFTFFFFLLALHSSKISRLVDWLELKLQCLLLHSPKPLNPPIPSIYSITYGGPGNRKP